MITTDWSAVAALALVALFGMTVGRTRRASPMLATRAVITLSFVVTGSLAATLVVLALPLLGRDDVLADHAHWSDAVFRRDPLSSVTVGVLAVLALTGALLRVFVELRRQVRHTTAANRFRDDVGAVHGETVVAALDRADAMTLSSGVIVLTPSLIRALGPDERRAVLAHERSHLRHRHHRLVQAAALLAAANPLLRRLPDAIGYLTERWADEDAARVTSRSTTATALKRVAVLTVPHLEQTVATMHSAAIGVPERIVALESGPLRVSWHRLVSPALLGAGAVGVALVAAERTLDLFQLAHALART